MQAPPVCIEKRIYLHPTLQNDVREHQEYSKKSCSEYGFEKFKQLLIDGWEFLWVYGESNFLHQSTRTLFSARSIHIKW